MNRKRRQSGASQPMPAPVLRLLGCAVLLLAVPLAVAAALMVPAGISSYQAQAFVAHWQKSGEEPSPQAYDIAHGAAQRSVDLYPSANGLYLDQLGVVEQWKAFRHSFADPKAADSRRAALENFRLAVTARPTWPSAWINLAWAKAYLMEFDDEFDHALQQAAHLGPWRIGINRSLSELGFISWGYLTPQQRTLVLESAHRTVAHSPRQATELLKTATATGMSDALCESLPRKLAEDRRICSGTIYQRTIKNG